MLFLISINSTVLSRSPGREVHKKEYLREKGYEIQWGDVESKDPEGLRLDSVRS